MCNSQIESTPIHGEDIVGKEGGDETRKEL